MRTTLLVVAAALLIGCGGETNDPPLGPSSPSGPATASLTGVVTDEAGAPIRDVSVRLLLNPTTSIPSAFTTTNERGEYRLERLPAGNVLVQASTWRYSIATVPITLTGANAVNIRLSPLTQIVLSGVVQNADTGAPIGGAVITFLDGPGARDNAGFTTTAGSDGRYRFDKIYTANSNLAVTAPGFQEWRQGMNITSETTTLNLQLRPLFVPETVTAQVGGPPDTWTCRVQTSPPDMPCQQYPFMIRRSLGSVSATLTFGDLQGDLWVQVITSSGLVRGTVTAQGVNHRIDITSSYMPIGSYAIRVVKPAPNQSPTPYTLAIAVSD
jgi:hypothetical protein